MVYNSARCKMKRFVFFVIGVMIALVFASGCSKDVIVTQSSVYEFDITFSNATGKQIVTGNYTKLQDTNLSTQAILAYIKIGNTSGQDVWMPLPSTNELQLYDYAFTDNGIFVFSADAGEGYTWTADFTMQYRLILIPRTVIASKSMNEIENTDYNTVMKEFDLYNAPVIRK